MGPRYACRSCRRRASANSFRLSLDMSLRCRMSAARPPAAVAFGATRFRGTPQAGAESSSGEPDGQPSRRCRNPPACDCAASSTLIVSSSIAPDATPSSRIRSISELRVTMTFVPRQSSL